MTDHAHFSYLHAMADKPYAYLYPPPAGVARENGRYVEQRCPVADLRRAGATSLDVEGFRLIEHHSQMADFLDTRELTDTYYRECAMLARALTGARLAMVFDHLVREREADRPALGFGREGSAPAAVGRVHNDYTDASGRRRLELQCRGMDAREFAGRFAIVNLWRPLVREVRDTPLAVCDARSVRATERVAADIHYPQRSGEIYLHTYSPAHRWYYAPRMGRHEVLAFKSYDSATDVARFTPHAAFDEPDIPEGTPPRRSIEVRVLLVY